MKKEKQRDFNTIKWWGEGGGEEQNHPRETPYSGIMQEKGKAKKSSRWGEKGSKLLVCGKEKRKKRKKNRREINGTVFGGRGPRPTKRVQPTQHIQKRKRKKRNEEDLNPTGTNPR